MGAPPKPIQIDPEIAARCEGPDQPQRFKEVLKTMLGEAPVPIVVEPKKQGRPKKAK